MDLIDNIAQLASRVEQQKSICTTEEAVKTSLVLPFLKALGYDVFNPFEVRPEYVADVGVKKGEKVDYAISINDKIQILIECKPIGAKLELEHASQLFRYYAATEARFGLLTDGLRYCFYTDIDAPNKMDKRPFFVFEILNYKKPDISHLKKFAKDSFDIDAIVSAAENMKYQQALADEIREEFAQPSDEFTKLIATRVYDGRFKQSVSQKFSLLLKQAIADHIHETVDRRLKTALESGSIDDIDPSPVEEDSAEDNGVVTTQCETEGLFTIKAILAEVLDPERVVMRDSKSYCAILLDDNNRKPIVRLHFNNDKRLRVQIFDEPDPEKIDISRVAELYRYKLRILKAVAQHLRSDIEKSRKDAPNKTTSETNASEQDSSEQSKITKVG